MVFHIDKNGKYCKSSNGQVVESGTLSAIDQKWTIKTDAGLSDQGTFSTIGSELVLRSQSVGTSKWQRIEGVSSTKSASQTIAPTNQRKNAPNQLNLAQPATTTGSTSGSYNKYQSLSSNLNTSPQTKGNSLENPDKPYNPSTSATTSLNTGVSTVRMPTKELGMGMQPQNSNLANNLARGGNQLNLNPQAVAQAARSFGRGNIGAGLSNLFNAAKSNFQAPTNYPGNNSIPQGNGNTYTDYGGNGNNGNGSPATNYQYQSSQGSSSSGHGTYSAMRQSQEQKELSALPAPKPIVVNTNADDTTTYGISSIERRAFGPPKVVRIQIGVLP